MFAVGDVFQWFGGGLEQIGRVVNLGGVGEYFGDFFPGVSDVHVDVVWEPEWTPDKMSEAAKLQLNMM